MTFKLAEKQHDPGIRRLLREVEMPGAVRMTYEREPQYFSGSSVMGTSGRTLVYEKRGIVQAVACRYVKPVFINGSETLFGYFSGLRILPAARKGIILGRGYGKCRALHQDGNVRGYLSIIVSGNTAARHVLTSGRAGIPVYRDIGCYKVYSLLLNRFGRYRGGVTEILTGKDVGQPAVLRFLRTQGARRQYFPVYKKHNFGKLLKGLSLKDLHVAVRGSNIIGTLGSWDQRAYRQQIIRGYSASLRAGQSVINPILRICGRQPLPEIGSQLKTLTGALVCIADDNADVLTDLIKSVCRRHRKSGYFGLALGFHETDPLQQAVKGFCRIPYTSRLYQLYWEDGRHFCENTIDNRTPYLELGAL